MLREAPRLPVRARLLAAFAAAAVATPIVIAGRLTPDPRGWGTHEQLGWPICSLLRATGWRCPSCGMTTAWAYAAQGELCAALEANVGGTLLFAAACCVLSWLTAAAIVGRNPVQRVPLRIWLWLATAWLTATVLDWVRRLAAG